LQPLQGGCPGVDPIDLCRDAAVLQLVGDQLGVAAIVFNDEDPRLFPSSPSGYFKTLSRFRADYHLRLT
jgi:hypothetical protein